MHTAVDCNGSSNNSNNSTTTTTTTIMESNDINSDASTTAASRPTPTVLLTPVAMLEQTNVLRHRLQVGGGAVVGAAAGVGIGIGHKIGSTSVMNYDSPIIANTTTHKIVEPVSTPLIDMAEYLGSNVECMSVTPSPSPQASPSKKSQQQKRVTSLPITPLKVDATRTTNQCNTPSSTSSSSSSSSNSSTSSVIASPVNINRDLIGRRRGLLLEGETVSCISDDVALSATASNKLVLNGKDERVERRHALAIKGLPLHNVYEEHLTFITPTTPLTPAQTLLSPSSSSSSSSSSSLSACTNSANSSTSADSISLNSTSNSSKSSIVTVKSPAFDPTVQLQQWQDMPKYLQFNPYVLKGYRPLTTFKGCLLSLFYWHNETINILTHAIPIFYILAIVPGLMPWEQEFRFLSFCHLFGSVAPWCGSFLYHLFMNIERGEHVYYTLLKLDMVGIWVSQSFGALPLVTATTFCLSPIWKWLIIISYCLLSLWGLYKALTASSPWQRRLCFALPFTMRSILTFFRTIGVWVGGSRLALSHVYLQDGVSILGGVIGAMRIPEKWFPGLLDFYLNSHNIMHVLVVVAVYSMHKATIKDFEWMSATNCTRIAITINDIGETIDATFTSNVEL